MAGPKSSLPVARADDPCASEQVLSGVPLSADIHILRALFAFEPIVGPRDFVNLNSRIERDIAAHERNAPLVVAANFAYFIADPTFRCKKPLAYAAFARHFDGFVPYPTESCTPTNKVLVEATEATHRWNVVELDPQRIFQVHLLLADSGDALGSGFGHAMLRLIICSPSRIQIGPECLQDISHHLVVSFRAALDTPLVSAWSGLSGHYPSRLYVFEMNGILDEYLTREARSLRSIPLTLSRRDIEAIASTTIDYQWTYEGTYTFFTNNCATETLHLLQRALVSNFELQRITVLRPRALPSALSSVGLLEGQGDSEVRAQLEKGYFFSPAKQILGRSFSRLRDRGFIDRRTNLQVFLSLNAGERRRVFDQVRLLSDSRERNQSFAALIVLEEEALRSLSNEARAQLALRVASVLDNQSPALSDPAREVLFQLARLTKAYASPVHQLPTEPFGLPTDEAVRHSLNPDLQLSSLAQLTEATRSLLPAALLEEVAATQFNLKSLRRAHADTRCLSVGSTDCLFF